MSTQPGHRSRAAPDAWLGAVDAILAESSSPTPPLCSDIDQVEPLGKLWMKIPKERDLELHVRVGWILGTEFVALADFVPSTGRYEQQILVERRQFRPLLAELRRLYFYLGGRASPSFP